MEYVIEQDAILCQLTRLIYSTIIFVLILLNNIIYLLNITKYYKLYISLSSYKHFEQYAYYYHNSFMYRKWYIIHLPNNIAPQ